MLPAPIEHRFRIDGEPYLLVQWDRGGDRRMKAEFAIAIAPAPGVIDTLDGQNLWREAVARECLREAPDLFWDARPAAATQNGLPYRVVSLDKIPMALWDLFAKEVDAFLALIFPAAPAESGGTPTPGDADALAVAGAQALPSVFRGRAE